MKNSMDPFLGLLLAAAFLIRLPFLLQPVPFFDFDEATFALMARHILQGEFPFYIWGHSYSGSLTSFVMSGFIAVLGTHPLAAKLTALLFFLIFVALNYVLLKRLFNQTVSLFASLGIVLMPPGMLDISMRVWGGHAELWGFSAAVLLLLSIYFDRAHSSRSKFMLLFLTGLFAGIALWLSALVLLLLIPYGVFFILRVCADSGGPLRAWGRAFSLLPRGLRWILTAVHGFLGLFLLMQCAAMLPQIFAGTWLEPLIQTFATHPPFRIKEMKKIVFFLTGEVLFLWIFTAPAKSDQKTRIGRAGSVFAGWALGYLPALLFNSLGGEGLRIFHKSGVVLLPALASRVREVFLEKIPHLILGFPPYGAGSGPPDFNLEGGLYTLFILAVVAATIFIFWRDFSIFWGNAPQVRKSSYVAAFFLVGIFTIAANLVSSLEAARYMAACYLALAVILGVFLGQILWPRSKVLALLAAGLVAGHYLHADFRFYQAVPKEPEKIYQEMLDYLERRQIYGGWAPRVLAPVLTFLSGERVVLAATSPPERYLPYQQYVQSLRRRAVIVQKSEPAPVVEGRELIKTGRITDSKIIGDYTLYLVEGLDGDSGEGGADRRYLETVPKQGLRFYLNE